MEENVKKPGGETIKNKQGFSKKYSDKEILEHIKRHCNETVKYCRNSFDRDKTVCSAHAVEMRFGSWKAALEKAGIESKDRRKEKRYSNKEMLEQIKKHCEENPNWSSKTFDKDKNTCNRSTVLKRFGSWNAALKKTGITLKNRSEILQRYSDEELLDQLKRHCRENSNYTKDSFDSDKSVCAASVLQQRFGSWKAALEKAGINIKEHVKEKVYSDEEILEQLKNHFDKYGECKKKIFDKDKNTCSSTTVNKRFGNWKTALSKADIQFLEPRIYTKEEIIEEYKKAKDKMEDPNKPMGYETFKNETGVPYQAINKLFGTWNNFLSEIDEKNIFRSKVEETQEELLEMYRKFSVQIGRDGEGATEKEIDKLFIYSSGVLYKKCFSINEMREKLGFEPKLHKPLKYTKEELEKILLELYDEYKRKLGISELFRICKERKLPTTDTFIRYFDKENIKEVWKEVLAGREKV